MMMSLRSTADMKPLWRQVTYKERSAWKPLSSFRRLDASRTCADSGFPIRLFASTGIVATVDQPLAPLKRLVEQHWTLASEANKGLPHCWGSTEDPESVTGESGHTPRRHSANGIYTCRSWISCRASRALGEVNRPSPSMHPNPKWISRWYEQSNYLDTKKPAREPLTKEGKCFVA